MKKLLAAIERLSMTFEEYATRHPRTQKGKDDLRFDKKHKHKSYSPKQNRPSPWSRMKDPLRFRHSRPKKKMKPRKPAQPYLSGIMPKKIGSEIERLETLLSNGVDPSMSTKKLTAKIEQLEKKATPSFPMNQKNDGEGSRGGKVIGHTKSGKPIYETHSAEEAHSLHPNFTPKDHEEARHFHSALAGAQVHPKRMGVPGAQQEYDRQHGMAGNHVAAKYMKMEQQRKNPH